MFEFSGSLVYVYNMHLLIYETTHHETIPALLELGSMHFKRITIFMANRQAAESISETVLAKKNISLITRTTESNRQFIQRVFRFISKEKCHHFHISTFDNNRLLLALKLFAAPSLSTSMSVQAVNEYCHFRFNTVKAFSESAAKKLMHYRVRQYRVFSPMMQARLQQQLKQAEVHYIPSDFYHLQGTSSITKNFLPFTIVIPGTVDNNRRNYSEVEILVQEIKKRLPAGNTVQIVLAGAANSEYGTEVVRNLEKLSSPTVSVICYNTYLSQQEYDNWLSKAHIIWSPLQLHTMYKGIAEVYGDTTATGLISDILKHGKPAFLPQNFMVPPHYQHAIIHYQQPDTLVTAIIELLSSPEKLLAISADIRNDFSHINAVSFSPDFVKMTGISAITDPA